MKKSIKKIETKAVKNIKVIKGGGDNNGYKGFGDSSSFEIDNNMY